MYISCNYMIDVPPKWCDAYYIFVTFSSKFGLTYKLSSILYLACGWVVVCCVCVWVDFRAYQFLRHYWKMTRCIFFGWTNASGPPTVHWPLQDWPVNQWTPTIGRRKCADECRCKAPLPFCVVTQLAGAYLPDLAWSTQKWVNWLTLNRLRTLSV